MRNLPAAAILSALLGAFGVIVTAAAVPTTVPKYQKYDDYFRKYTARYFGDTADWRVFKAQGIVESGLRPTVVSPVGARGVMQIMPSTYADIRKHNKDAPLRDIDDPESNIAAGIWYARQEYSYWLRASEDKHHNQFMFGSYNAGRGTIMRAQKAAEAEKMNQRRWPSIERVAPHVQKWRYQETLSYVVAIYANLDSIARNGAVTGATISKDNGDGSTLPNKLKNFLDKFKKGWKPEWGGEIVGRVKGGFSAAKEGAAGAFDKIKPKLRRGGD
jgi:soluble lytic murein transglycosylase-like protein